MQKFKIDNLQTAYSVTPSDYPLENANKNGHDKPIILWAHGWGQTHQSFSNIIAPLSSHATHIALDLPGFGASDNPHEDWGTEDYAHMIAQWIKDKNLPPVIWVGHSFGCRVGVQFAAHYPELLSDMVLIAGAGLKRKRPLLKKIYFYIRIRLFKALRRFVPEGALKEKLMKKFGSQDYKTAGAMRKIFVRVVNEDLSDKARRVTCPTTLIFGSNDIETPPEFGERYSRLIKRSKLHLLEGQDHYSVLGEGRHPVIKIIHDVIINSNKSGHI